jgi:hypothetical protein
MYLLIYNKDFSNYSWFDECFYLPNNEESHFGVSNQGAWFVPIDRVLKDSKLLLEFENEIKQLCNSLTF